MLFRGKRVVLQVSIQHSCRQTEGPLTNLKFPLPGSPFLMVTRDAVVTEVPLADETREITFINPFRLLRNASRRNTFLRP